jgi:hypothetical protein
MPSVYKPLIRIIIFPRSLLSFCILFDTDEIVELARPDIIEKIWIKNEKFLQKNLIDFSISLKHLVISRLTFDSYKSGLLTEIE